MSSRKLEPNADNFEAKKKAEVDAAWEAYSTMEYAAQAKQRREWLEKHLISQRNLCGYCCIVTTDTTVAGIEDRRATIDHIVPRSGGGPDTFENTLAACAYCNTRKGNRSVDEYKGSPDLIRRIELALIAPDRLSNDPESPFYDPHALARGVGIRFKGKERSDVCEYSISGG